METAGAPFEAAFKRASTLYDVGKYDLAIRFALDAIAAKPNHAGAHVILANSNERLGRLAEAQAAARRAIAADPDYAPAYVALGMARHAANAYWEALQAFTHAVQLNPRYADAYRLVAHTQMNLQRYREALVTVKQALALNPQSVAAHEVQAICLRRLGRTSEAEVETAAVLRMRPESVLGLRQHGHLRLKRGDRDVALGAFREAIRLDPNSPHARRDYIAAILPFNLGRYGTALAAWSGFAFGCFALTSEDQHDIAFLIGWTGAVIMFTGRPLVVEAMRRDAVARSILGRDVLAVNRRSLAFLAGSEIAATGVTAAHAPALSSVAAGLLFASVALSSSIRPATKPAGRRVLRAGAAVLVAFAIAIAFVFESLGIGPGEGGAAVFLETSTVGFAYVLCWLAAAIANRYAK